MSLLQNIFRIGLIATLILVNGCATTHQSAANKDPLETYNRGMYKVNDTLDTALIKPIAMGYDAVVPDPIVEGISNVFSNLDEVTIIINDLLQGKFYQAYRDTYRFVLNSTVGVAGIFDVASLNGFTKNNEDFGQTLGVWGFGPGAYIVLPVFGTYTVRDMFGGIVDNFTDPLMYVKHRNTRLELLAVRTIDTRANLLNAERVLDQAAIDEYSYVREAYRSRREYLIFDGNPPIDDEFDIFEDD